MPIVIPVNAFITPFSENGQDEPSQWSEATVDEAVSVASRIWSSANIRVSLRACTLDAAYSIRRDARTNEGLILGALASRRPAGAGVNVFFINSVAGLTAGGLSYYNSEPEAACYVQCYQTAPSNGRVVAHEIGHLLRLEHVVIDFKQERRAARLLNNLMREGLSMGTELETWQISRARQSRLAQRFGG